MMGGSSNAAYIFQIRKIKHANLGCLYSGESLWETLHVEEEMDVQNEHFH